MTKTDTAHTIITARNEADAEMILTDHMERCEAAEDFGAAAKCAELLEILWTGLVPSAKVLTEAPACGGGVSLGGWPQ